MPYPETAATMLDLISQKLQDTGSTTWADTEQLLYWPEALREISQYSPQIRMLEFLIESRHTARCPKCKTKGKLMPSAFSFSFKGGV